MPSTYYYHSIDNFQYGVRIPTKSDKQDLSDDARGTVQRTYRLGYGDNGVANPIHVNRLDESDSFGIHTHYHQYDLGFHNAATTASLIHQPEFISSIKAVLNDVLTMANNPKFQQCVQDAVDDIAAIGTNNNSKTLSEIQEKLGFALQANIEPIVHQLGFYNNIFTDGLGDGNWNKIKRQPREQPHEQPHEQPREQPHEQPHELQQPPEELQQPQEQQL